MAFFCADCSEDIGADQAFVDDAIMIEKHNYQLPGTGLPGVRTSTIGRILVHINSNKAGSGLQHANRLG